MLKSSGHFVFHEGDIERAHRTVAGVGVGDVQDRAHFRAEGVEEARVRVGVHEQPEGRGRRVEQDADQGGDFEARGVLGRDAVSGVEGLAGCVEGGAAVPVLVADIRCESADDGFAAAVAVGGDDGRGDVEEEVGDAGFERPGRTVEFTFHPWNPESVDPREKKPQTYQNPSSTLRSLRNGFSAP